MMDEKTLLREKVNEFARTGSEQDGEIKVRRVQDGKTTFVEQSGDSGRSIMMNQYTVDGRIFWAGFSSRSQTVYISVAN